MSRLNLKHIEDNMEVLQIQMDVNGYIGTNDADELFDYARKMLAELRSVEIVKTKNGVPTVISFKGNTYILQHKNQFK